MAGKVSKNNITGATMKRYLGEDIVVPSLYDGHWYKRGVYMSGSVNKKLVLDNKGNPMHLKDIGEIR